MREALEQSGNRLITQMSPFLNASGLLLLGDLVAALIDEACEEDTRVVTTLVLHHTRRQA